LISNPSLYFSDDGTMDQELSESQEDYRKSRAPMSMTSGQMIPSTKSRQPEPTPQQAKKPLPDQPHSRSSVQVVSDSKLHTDPGSVQKAPSDLSKSPPISPRTTKPKGKDLKKPLRPQSQVVDLSKSASAKKRSLKGMFGNSQPKPRKQKLQEVLTTLETTSNTTLVTVNEEIDQLESQLSELKKARETSIQEQRPANEIAHINHEITRTTSSLQLKREASQVIQAQSLMLNKRLTAMQNDLEDSRPIRFSDENNGDATTNQSTTSKPTHGGEDSSAHTKAPQTPSACAEENPSFSPNSSPSKRASRLKRENCSTEFSTETEPPVVGNYSRTDFEEAFESVFGAIITFSGATLIEEGIKRAVAERGFWVAEFPSVDAILQTWQFGAPMSLDYMSCPPLSLCPFDEELNFAFQKYDASKTVLLLMLVRLESGQTASYWEILPKGTT